jgi:hypothetical protein
MWRARPKRLERIGVARQGMARMHFLLRQARPFWLILAIRSAAGAIRSAAEFQQGGL